MRRSKSNPAKYAKNYRSISQRKMTEHDEEDDEKEMERLRQILRESSVAQTCQEANDDTLVEKCRKKRQRTKGAKDLEEPSLGAASHRSPTVDPDDAEGPVEATAAATTHGILSAEMMKEYESDELFLLESKKKKSGSKKVAVLLTPAELKQAAALQKKTARKLKQLEDRAAGKQKRAALYASLQQTALSNDAMRLLSRTADLGKHVTKREQLQQLLRKERAGMALNETEQDILYQRRDVKDYFEDKKDNIISAAAVTSSTIPPNDNAIHSRDESKPASTGQKHKKQKLDTDDKSSSTQSTGARTHHVGDTAEQSTQETATDEDEAVNMTTDSSVAVVSESTTTAAVMPASGLSLAAQMMASLTTLKKESTVQAAQTAKEREEAELRRMKEEEKKHQPTQGYVPSKPIEIKTTQSYSKIEPKIQQLPSAKGIFREVQRPPDVAAVRYDLPVAAMEFEVMDAINNNDVTILCSETGSGKSTQIPQFLYEAGLSRCVASEGEAGTTAACIIGVTQPRRVAAVSTAKRVCYEMGQGNGQTILRRGPNKGDGNLVAYQTRYETAGLGRQTHIKFMTDGILLQEIQTDLLLRKYSVIVLDEAHERNLNTDVLIGLISVALPLRKQAAQESGLPPLKIVIMSATLRVEDFTGNKSLFSSTVPAVVTVPGRTHPVTIHHSKVTELDDYDDAAFKKTCKIHRQLPQGGILLFLTGKQEIIRMVNRLRRALNQSPNDRRRPQGEYVSLQDQGLPVETADVGNMPRDMDDDEVDGDIFQSSGPDDFDDAENDDLALGAAAEFPNDGDDAIPKKAIILPLYSLLSTEEQAQVFAPIPEGHRLIVVATNIAETSITIPGIAYVVDSGRQKCRNYNADTGVASFDIMWISKAAADQRAGRAGRTGPGHCYRLYSSSLYSRHMDAFALPEVLTRPLEDVVLAMKAMKISNVSDFPFPTPPDRRQVDAATKLLANIGCVDLSKVEGVGGDGEITRLGSAVAKLPLGVRYGKILLVAAEAGVLDYAIAVVAALSESNPFVTGGQSKLEENDADAEVQDADEERTETSKKRKSQRWSHKSGDALAAMLAVGAYTFAGRGAGGASEKLACKKFCEENGLHPVVMERIQTMRSHLARLSKIRLGSAEGVAPRTGGFLSSMPPPNKLQESLLCQSIASGLLDNIAVLAPLGSIPGQHPFSLRSAYLSCSSTVKEPLFMDRNSAVYSRDSRQLPQWICFDTLMRKTLNNGTSVAIMKNITPIDPSWLGRLAEGSRLLTIGEPLPLPLPVYDSDCDAVMCSVKTKFGSHGWEIPPIKKEMFDALQTTEAKHSSNFMSDDSFRWFCRYLFEGKVFPEMKGLADMLNDSPSIITRHTPVAKVALVVSELSGVGVDSASALRKYWAEVDNKFLFSSLKRWVKDDRVSDFKKLWIVCVKVQVRHWQER